MIVRCDVNNYVKMIDANKYEMTTSQPSHIFEAHM